MFIKFIDGIDIFIDDEKLALWEQDNGFVKITMNGGEKIEFNRNLLTFAVDSLILLDKEDLLNEM